MKTLTTRYEKTHARTNEMYDEKFEAHLKLQAEVRRVHRWKSITKSLSSTFESRRTRKSVETSVFYG